MTTPNPTTTPLSPEREAQIREDAAAAKPGHNAIRDVLAELDRIRAWHENFKAGTRMAGDELRKRLADAETQRDELKEQLLTAQGDVALEAARADKAKTEQNRLQARFDELEELGRELLNHCTAEYGGPGYTHCELPTGHDGQHESALGNMRRATWGAER